MQQHVVIYDYYLQSAPWLVNKHICTCIVYQLVSICCSNIDIDFYLIFLNNIFLSLLFLPKILETDNKTMNSINELVVDQHSRERLKNCWKFCEENDS